MCRPCLQRELLLTASTCVFGSLFLSLAPYFCECRYYFAEVDVADINVSVCLCATRVCRPCLQRELVLTRSTCVFGSLSPSLSVHVGITSQKLRATACRCACAPRERVGHVCNESFCWPQVCVYLVLSLSLYLSLSPSLSVNVDIASKESM